MKGSPLRELILVVLVGLFALWPLMKLTGRSGASGTVAEEPHSPEELQRVESWLELLFSHPPKRVRVIEEGTVLLDSGGELQADLDADLHLRDGVMQLELIIEWPDQVEQGYVELSVEPGNLPAAKAGAWGQGQQEELFEFSWQGSE